MGDVAMTVPVLRMLKQQYPQLKITVLTRKFFAPMFANIPGVKVHFAALETRHKGVFGIYKLFKEVAALDIEVVADLHHVIRSKILKLLFNFRGIKVVQLNKGRAEKKALTRATNKVFEPLKSMHQRYADVFEQLGFVIDVAKEPCREPIELTPRILALTGSSPQKWIGIAPFAQYEGKTYPLDQMIKVIASLQSQEGLHVFLFGGGKKEGEILHSIASKYPNVTNAAGKLLFEEELALIANLDLMVAMDSGNAHLAAMYGIPVVTIWGVTHPYAGFMPFGQPMDYAILPDLTHYDQIPTSVYGNKMPPGYEQVMKTITPERVVAKVLEIIA